MSIVINGENVDIPGVLSHSFRELDWCRCFKKNRETWTRQLFLHKTIADDPEQILPGFGPPGGAKMCVDDWKGKVVGAHLVMDWDGVLYCLADLALEVTEHATKSNSWSIGFETKELRGGRVWRGQLENTVRATLFVCRKVGIQLQMPKIGTYTGHPIPRMTHGGPDMVGIFGHRDNTEERGRWDPGDELFSMLAKCGVEQFDFASGEDLKVWKVRQDHLNTTHRANLKVDGVPGPATVAALEHAGYIDGIFALGKA